MYKLLKHVGWAEKPQPVKEGKPQTHFKNEFEFVLNLSSETVCVTHFL